MDMHSKKQYLQALQAEYLKAGKTEKIRLLNEAEKRTGLVRKYLIRRLSAKTRWDKPPRTSKRSSIYTTNLIAPLVRLWDIFDESCGQRLKPMIETELERLRQFDEIWITDKEAEQLKKMSSKTIDRLLEHEKAVRLISAKYRKGGNPLLYQKIPTKLSEEWDRTITGQIQIDGVEHCGVIAKGEYLNTVATTDIASHWWEAEIVMGKGQQRTTAAIKKIRSRYPMSWKEIHPDNGFSFINRFLYDYTQRTKLKFSRSRPYKKNDNCFIEQKNSKAVRQTLGHVRYDTLKEMKIINDLYNNELRLYKNFFQPVMRLDIKERTKGHIYRKYQKAKTPYQWLMDDPKTPQAVKIKLYLQYFKLNPAKLKREIEEKLKLLSYTYQNKHKNSENYQEINDPKVTLSFDPTTPFRLPIQMT